VRLRQPGALFVDLGLREVSIAGRGLILAWVLWSTYRVLGPNSHFSATPEGAYPTEAYDVCVRRAKSQADLAADSERSSANVVSARRDPAELGTEQRISVRYRDGGWTVLGYICLPDGTRPE
jgi:hypothetical protein